MYLVTEELTRPETRTIVVPDVGEQAVTGMRHYWLALEEIQNNGWEVERVAELAWEETEAQGLEFGHAFLGLIAFIQADGRAVLGVPEGLDSKLPLLPSGYTGRDNC